METKIYAESEYITPKLVEESPTKKAIVLGDAKGVVAIFSGKEVPKVEIPVEMDGKSKTYSPNKDTLKNIHKVLGSESKAWIGKTITFQLMNYGGKEIVVGTIRK